jgi:hypothetical protein
MIKKFAVAALAATGLVAVAGPSAANAWTGPCATQRALFEKYNIQFDMHQEQVEAAYGEACRRLG